MSKQKNSFSSDQDEAVSIEQLDLFNVKDVAAAQMDFEQEWKGMPEFNQDDKTPFKTILVHFDSFEDVQAFARLVNHRITNKTKFIWYPKKDRSNLKGTAYSDES